VQARRLDLSRVEEVAMPVRGLLSSARQRRYGVVNSSDSRTSAPARFAAALADALTCRHEVVRIASTTPALAGAHPSVSMASPRPLAAIAGELNQCDVAIIHHSVDDDKLPNRHPTTPSSFQFLDVIEMVRQPTIVVLHHVPADPSADQRRTLALACRTADVVAVTAATAALRLASTYDVDPSALWLLRSGPTTRPGRAMRHRSPTVVTWGPIAPGGGIESMVDAMEHLSALDVRYLIAGPTSDGPATSESGNYRETLIRRCWIRGVAAHVTFVRDDADQTAMTETLRDAVAVVVPQDVAGNQIDGFFEEMLAAGVPIVATDVAASSQILPLSAALLVPRGDPAALADAVLRILIDPHLGESMIRSVARMSPPATWPSAARQLDRLADAAIRSTATAWRHAV
jgi:glycosyltransferase involved in cell wall biosynthesis